MKRFLKGFLIALGILIGVVLLAAIGLFGYLTVTEYKPAATEQVTVQRSANSLSTYNADSFKVIGWNIGYGALGQESDFFMDGGTQVRPESADIVAKNMLGIKAALTEADADFCLLQEVDSGSTRSFGRQEVDELSALPAYGASAYAYNYKTDMVPYPLPPLGKVRSGLLTLSRYEVKSAERIALPCPFSWPVSTANLKRCLLVTRIPIFGSPLELVLVNLHLEAYDDGEGKIAQTQQLLSFLDSEAEKGNYVVAGGDWNQLFPSTEEVFPIHLPELWMPGALDGNDFGSWRMLFDVSAPTCRLLNQPYNPADHENTQYYVIDGFVVSKNIEVVNYSTLDLGFAYSDHNPVLLELRFKE